VANPTEAILEIISDDVFTVDMDWHITSFNRAAEEITGVPREEAILRRCSEVFRSSMCNGGLISISHLPEELTARGASAAMGADVRSAHDLLDAQSIRTALERNGYNRLAAARELGIHKTTLFRRIKKLAISIPAQDGRSRKIPTR